MTLDREILLALGCRVRQRRGVPVYLDIGVRDGLAGSWDQLARAGLLRAYGFDPAADHVQELARRDPHVQYLPLALGERAERRRLNHTFMPGCSSFLEPNHELLREYPSRKIFEVVGHSEIDVHALDDLVSAGKVPPPDILKIDTQGFELPILRGAIHTLEGVSCIELETQFKPMYQGQALFGEVKEFLERQGFILRHLRVNGPYEGEFLEADAFYSRRPALDSRLDLIRLWQSACAIESPSFLAQMNDWLPAWLEYLTDEQRELCRRLFGRLDSAEE